jgi:hypothetical protein
MSSVFASEAKQSSSVLAERLWIASSQELLAMTTDAEKLRLPLPGTEML